MAKLRRLISLRGVTRKPVTGQISTFFMVLMVVVLIMGIFISNMGQLSTDVVGVANATDSASLFLGSQLATKANVLCKQLNKDNIGTCPQSQTPPRYCVRTGWLGTVLAVLVVVVAFALPGAQPLAPWALGFLTAGANALGSGIALRDWKAARLGAIQGYGIGFGMAGGINMFTGAHNLARATAGYAAANPTISVAGVGGVAGGTSAFVPMALGSATVVGTSTAPFVSGPGDAEFNARNSMLAANYSKALNADVGENAAAKVDKAAITQSLSDLPEYERMREGTLLEALSTIVDDPNMTVGPNGGSGCHFPDRYGPAVGDPFDVDGDGDTAEAISCLNYWWSERVRALTAGANVRQNLVTSFMEGPWNGQATAGTMRDRLDKARSVLPFMERSEVECECRPVGDIPSEGATVEYFRRVDSARASYPGLPDVSSIFQAGPDQATLRALMDDPCDPDCPPAPEGWDSIDGTQMQYEEFVLRASALVYNPVVQAPCGFSSQAEWYKHLANTTEEWLPKLYDPDSTTDAYDQLAFIQGEMVGWFLTGREIARRSPPCHLAYDEYPPVFSSREFDPPACDNLAIAVDPNRCAMNGTYDTNPIYNCTYVNDSSPATLTTGAHLANNMPGMDFNPDFGGTFPGPMCRIDLTHKTELTRQMDIIEPFVQNPALQQYIQANYATHFDNPLPACPAPPPPPGPSCTPTGGGCGAPGDCCSGSCNICSLGRNNAPCPAGDSDCCSTSCDVVAGTCIGDGPPDACTGTDPGPPESLSEVATPPDQMQVVSIDKMALAKFGTPDQLDYTYTFEFQCRNCVRYNGVTNCGPPYGPITEQRSKFYPEAGVLDTPDLAVVEQTTGGGLDAQQKFVEAMRQMRLILTGLKANLDDDRHIYATTDADPGGTFDPAIGGGAEGSDAAGGEVFVNHAEPYDPIEPAGLAALEYFLLQLEDFYNQIQNAADVQPAKDGSLPNPLQLISDPIRGGAHPVDGLYEWQDSRGQHSVTVEIGPFIKAWTSEPIKSGNFLWGKKCIQMNDYCDNTAGCPYRGPDRTWVRITRKDPTNQDIGLWRWNPFAGTIRKVARATYNHISVGVCGTSGGDCP